MKTSGQYLDELREQLKSYNKKAAGETCDGMIRDIFSHPENFVTADIEKMMQQLRNKRLFRLIQLLVDATIQMGKESFKIRRQYAQALIDENKYTAALAVLKDLVADTLNTPGDVAARFENTEAMGLSGRVYKQFYLNTANTDHIKKAAAFYWQVYHDEPQAHAWHGINVVALLKRAQRDHLNISGYPPPDELAATILQNVIDKDAAEKTDAWDYAIAAEACVALNKTDEALKWISGYARMPACDAFEIASTLRQMEQVWQLDMNSASGMLLLPLLRAELMKREGGNIVMDATELKLQRSMEKNISQKYTALMEDIDDSNPKVKLEKVFGDDSFRTYKWYMTGASRCNAVARIGTDSTKGFGTGFILKGSDLHESIKDELVLLTNAHVVSNDPAEKALTPAEAVIIFETLNREEEFRVAEIIWSSPSDALDATVIRFSDEDLAKLKLLIKDIKLFPIIKSLPVKEPPNSQRIYVIGHPFGGTLQVSFQDNVLLDHQDPKIHYRTPTEGGSSGSPVFNQQWDLIGLHHAGSAEMPCLNGKAGTYEANEGIWIQAIRNKIFK